MPGLSQGEAAREFVAMFKRHSEAVRSIFVQAIEEQAAALFDKTLPQSCLLRTWHGVQGKR